MNIITSLSNIIASASKIVFILMALGTIYLTAVKIMDVKDFTIMASMVFVYYFGKPSTPNDTLGGK